ncbi:MULTISPECIES: glutathione S-transferase family protein [unclassified Mesorhizobium]|uniref:glutathione S-transferase family protein n=1 Tax=unclassified Mesorhizobium TaxID=325217 RepID=UPI0019257CC7|nr:MULTISPECIES: glutathione S-transferase family protein [unclassified Mesorhizobium]BCH28001.1 glutathione S-transferase [Mesorhizobium sp. L-8-3]
MYTLYSRPGSGGFAVEAAFRLAGQPFTLVNVPKQAPGDDFLAISPLGQVPVLTLPCGRSITESGAMVTLVAERFPEAELAPQPQSPGRAEFLRWMFFMSSALYPALLRYFYAQRYTSDPGAAETVQNAALAESDRCFAVIENALSGRQWLVDDRFSLADVYLLMLAHWHPVGDRPREEWTNIVRHCSALKRQPVLADLNETHRLW